MTDLLISEKLKTSHISSNWDLEFEQFCQKKLTGITTGVEELDKAILGLHGVILIQGGPAVNKSTLCTQIANHHAKKVGPVIFFDRENGVNRLRMRLICQSAKASQTDVILAFSEAATNRESFDIAVSRLKKAPLHIVNNEELNTIDEMVGAVSAQYKRPVLLVIDSLQKMPLKGGDKRLSSDYWMNGFDDLKLKYENQQLNIIVVSEKKRGTYNEATMDGSKESGDNEYTAEIILDMRASAGTIICTVMKDRDGVTGHEIRFRKQLVDQNNDRSFCYMLEPDQLIEDI